MVAGTWLGEGLGKGLGDDDGLGEGLGLPRVKTGAAIHESAHNVISMPDLAARLNWVSHVTRVVGFT